MRLPFHVISLDRCAERFALANKFTDLRVEKVLRAIDQQCGRRFFEIMAERRNLFPYKIVYPADELATGMITQSY